MNEANRAATKAFLAEHGRSPDAPLVPSPATHPYHQYAALARQLTYSCEVCRWPNGPIWPKEQHASWCAGVQSGDTRTALRAWISAYGEASDMGDDYNNQENYDQVSLCADKIEALTDRLLLEVQAEMQCYRDMTNRERCRGNPTGEDNPFAGDEPFCPSCKAREKLNKEPAVGE